MTNINDLAEDLHLRCEFFNNGLSMDERFHDDYLFVYSKAISSMYAFLKKVPPEKRENSELDQGTKDAYESFRKITDSLGYTPELGEILKNKDNTILGKLMSRFIIPLTDEPFLLWSIGEGVHVLNVYNYIKGVRLYGTMLDGPSRYEGDIEVIQKCGDCYDFVDITDMSSLDKMLSLIGKYGLPLEIAPRLDEPIPSLLPIFHESLKPWDYWVTPEPVMRQFMSEVKDFVTPTVSKN